MSKQLQKLKPEMEIICLSVYLAEVPSRKNKPN